MKHIGNLQLLSNSKMAFLCSDKYSSKSVLAAYDWASDAVKNNITVVSGFQSRLEKDVFDILIKGKQPIVIVLARNMYKSCPAKYKQAVDDGRLLILSYFDDDVPIVTKERAYERNLKVVELADTVVFGHVSPGGMLEKLSKEINKPFNILG